MIAKALAAYFCAMIAWATPLPNDQLQAMHAAIVTGDLAAVNALVAKSPTLVNAVLSPQPNGRDWPALLVAVAENQLEIARYLLDHGANVNYFAADKHDAAAVFLVESPAMTKLLLERGAKVNLRRRDSMQTPVEEAARNGNVAIVRLFLAAGATLDFDSYVKLGMIDDVKQRLKKQPWLVKRPNTPLHKAAETGDLAMTKLLLDHGADPNATIWYSNAGASSALSEALSYGHFEVARLLCEKGANANIGAADKFHSNLLHFAIAERDIKYLQLLLKQNPDVSELDAEGLSPLHVAVEVGSIEKTKLLLDCGADVNQEAAGGGSALFFAAAKRDQPLFDLLLSRGARLDPYSACLLGRKTDVERMLAADRSMLNRPDRRLKRTPLFYALMGGSADVADLLIRKGANVNVRAFPYEGSSNIISGPNLQVYDDEPKNEIIAPLFVAAGGNLPAIVRLLVEHGADVNAKGERQSVLHLLCSHGDVENIKLVLDKGVNVHAKDFRGATALHYACGAGNFEIIKLLLAKGAKVNAQDNEAATPLHWSTHRPDVIEFLIQSGANVNAETDTRETALSRAAAHGQAKTVALLRRHGAKLDIFAACDLHETDEVVRIFLTDPRQRLRAEQPYSGGALLIVAIERGYIDIVKALIDNGIKIQADEDGQCETLNRAIRCGRREIVDLLLKKGVTLNAKTGGPLLEAVKNADAPMVAHLAGKGANIRPNDPYYRNSLLHEVGIDLLYRKFPDRTLDDRAKQQVATTVKILIAAGLDVNAPNRGGWTPLHSAVRRGHIGLVEALLQNRADVTARDHFDGTPLDFALEEIADADNPSRNRNVGLADKGNGIASARQRIVELLRKHGGGK